MTGYFRKNAVLIIILGFSIVLGSVYAAEAGLYVILSGTSWSVSGTSTLTYSNIFIGEKTVVKNQSGIMTFAAGGAFSGDVFTGTWTQQVRNYTISAEPSVVAFIENLLSEHGITGTITIKKISIGGTVSVTNMEITLNAYVKGVVDVTSPDVGNAGFIASISLSGTLPVGGSAWIGLSNPAITAGTPSCGQFASDPVNCNSGNLVETATDISVPGRGRALNLTRTYNSLYAASGGAGMFGPGWTSSYDESLTIGSNAVTVRQAGGATVTFIPTNPGFSAPSYVTATLVQNKNGTYTFTLKNQQSDTFDKTGRLISQTDRNGLVTTLTYDATSGQLTKVADPAERALTFTWSNGVVSGVTDPADRTVSYTYDTSGNLSTVSDVGGNVTSYSYAPGSALLVSAQDPLGYTLSNQYDGSNRVVQQTDQLGKTTTLSYGAVQNGVNSTTVTDPKGNVSVHTFTNSLLTTLTQGSGTATWTYGYDSNMNRISVTDADGKVWQTAYDSKGNPIKNIDPFGDTVTTTYTSLNDPATITDQLGVKTTFTYTSHGDLASTSRPLSGTSKSAKTTLAYGDSKHPGDITSVTDPTGAKTTFTYDQYGNRVSTVDPDGGKTTRSFDIIGRMLTSVSPLGNVGNAAPGSYTTSYAYDAFGKVTSVTDPLGHTATNAYDAKEELIAYTDQDGRQTNYHYDGTGRLITTVRGDGSTISNTYDPNGNLTIRTDGNGNATTFEYDALDRPSSMADALGRTTTYSYDGNGNRIEDTAPDGETVSRTFDAAGRCTGISYSDSKTPAVTFQYDKTGRRKGMTDGSGGSTWKYDSLGRLTSFTNGANQVVLYQYDLRGLPTAITYPNGKSVTRAYDGARRLLSVADWLKNTVKFQYDGDGNLLSATYPNGWTGQYQYDEADRATGIDYKNETAGLSLGYTRTGAGLLASEALNSGTPTTYTYDQAARLTAASGQGDYTYDAGDRVTAMPTVSALAYDVADQLAIAAGGTFTYDERGNRIGFNPNSQPTLTYSYDGVNRLIGYGSGASYAYDGDGLRVSKTVDGKAENYTWDRQAALPRILGDGTSYFIYGTGFIPLEQVNGSTVNFYHTDQLGSIRMLTDSTGAQAATYTYDVYGNLVSSTGQASNPFGYAGEYADAESGLIYLRARYYDPSTAQFITKDPLFATTRQAYSYADDSPTNFVDPSGARCNNTILFQVTNYGNNLLNQPAGNLERYSGVNLNVIGY
ncbi:MAG: RHS repeat-associated core domain-containing protein [Syntrophobacteraceae bacterium]